MRVSLIFVLSIDGKTTKWDSPSTEEWNSDEDKAFFMEMRKKSNVILMGSGTFTASNGAIKAEEGKLRIVMTSTPEKFKDTAVPGQLEFTNRNPKEVLTDIESRGFSEVLHVGGGRLATAFLKENLITDIYVTLEPKIFGEGKSITGEKIDVSFRLESMKQLNNQGTLLLHYTKA